MLENIDETTLFVPMRRYFRPNGHSEMGHLIIPDARTPDRLSRLEWIASEHIEFTMEAFPNMANICMDDGSFDYKYEVVMHQEVNAKVLEMIDNFNLQDYRNAASRLLASD
jgi:hypothetical protein